MNIHLCKFLHSLSLSVVSRIEKEMENICVANVCAFLNIRVVTLEILPGAIDL